MTPAEKTHENGNPQTNHSPKRQPAPIRKSECVTMVQMSTTHPLRNQIKAPETTTHPNGHPPMRKTEYKARDPGAKSVPHPLWRPPKRQPATRDLQLVPTTRPMVNHQAQPPVPHTRPSGDGTTHPPKWYHTPALVGVWCY
ncbi:hypothetical protein BS47DRAFT_1370044 [Hydnum rufescens UP504]|uniref:Uncharacterized protein n=1 Tax=Hydnum rufescens UP504 TaxID=1448309 RepID=A0A9P6DL51_9AGAM|nr:hypothetical protein BS47DRAFT_1370044 [Hydnum rufescens UP504]